MKALNQAQLADTMTERDMFIRGEELFRRLRIEIVSADSTREQIKRFDKNITDPEAQASDWRASLVKRLGDAEIRRVGAELAIKSFILEAAEVIKAQQAGTLTVKKVQAA
jgi:hypothetical protein